MAMNISLLHKIFFCAESLEAHEQVVEVVGTDRVTLGAHELDIVGTNGQLTVVAIPLDHTAHAHTLEPGAHDFQLERAHLNWFRWSKCHKYKDRDNKDREKTHYIWSVIFT
jgi:hypothetical protein